MDKEIRAEIFLRRFSRMQVIILGRIDKELDDDVFVKVMTANFLTVICVGSEKECIYFCLSMRIQENMFMSTAAHP